MARKNITKGMRLRILDRDGWRCQYCGATPADERLCVDHIKPVSKGGTNGATNLITACYPCNEGKSDLVLANPPHPDPLETPEKPARDKPEKSTPKLIGVILTFREYIMNRRETDTPVGDLASDVRREMKRNPDLTINSLKELRDHMERKGAIDDAMAVSGPLWSAYRMYAVKHMDRACSRGPVDVSVLIH